MGILWTTSRSQIAALSFGVRVGYRDNWYLLIVRFVKIVFVDYEGVYVGFDIVEVGFGGCGVRRGTEYSAEETRECRFAAGRRPG